MREDSHKKVSIPDSYRRPKGHHSRSRQKRKGAIPLAKSGRRSPKETRDLHPSGFEEVLVHNQKELEGLGENQAARIASKVGGRKKEKILERAAEQDIHVLNGETEDKNSEEDNQ